MATVKIRKMMQACFVEEGILLFLFPSAKPSRYNHLSACTIQAYRSFVLMLSVIYLVFYSCIVKSQLLIGSVSQSMIDIFSILVCTLSFPIVFIEQSGSVQCSVCLSLLKADDDPGTPHPPLQLGCLLLHVFTGLSVSGDRMVEGEAQGRHPQNKNYFKWALPVWGGGSTPARLIWSLFLLSNCA